jgi:CRP-like cAMP-binding protein
MNLQNISALALHQHIVKTIKLSESEFEQIAARFMPKSIRKGQYLLQEGDVCNHDYFVVKGALRQYYMHDNKERVNQFAFKDWWISDWHSMLNRLPSLFFIDALEDSEVLQIDNGSLDALFEEVPKFDKFYRIIFQRAFSAQQKRIACMQKSAIERYEDFVSMYGHFEQHVSQTQIASYLGITRESLSRIKNQSLVRMRD